MRNRFIPKRANDFLSSGLAPAVPAYVLETGGLMDILEMLLYLRSSCKIQQTSFYCTFHLTQSYVKESTSRLSHMVEAVITLLSERAGKYDIHSSAASGMTWSCHFRCSIWGIYRFKCLVVWYRPSIQERISSYSRGFTSHYVAISPLSMPISENFCVTAFSDSHRSIIS